MRAGVAENSKQGGGSSKNQEDEENKEAEDKQVMQTTQAVGPSFYYSDIDNYKKKFEKHIKDRESYKRQF